MAALIEVETKGLQYHDVDEMGVIFHGLVGFHLPILGQFSTQVLVDLHESRFQQLSTYALRLGSLSAAYTLRKRWPSFTMDGMIFSFWVSPLSSLALAGRMDVETTDSGLEFERLVHGVALRPLECFGLGPGLEIGADLVSVRGEWLKSWNVGVNFHLPWGVSLHGRYLHEAEPRFEAGLTVRFASGDFGGAGLFDRSRFHRGSGWLGIRLVQEREPFLAPPRLMFFENTGTIVEAVSQPKFLQELPLPTLGVTELKAFLDKIQEARDDPHNRALVFLNQDFEASYDQILSIRAALGAYKAERGKKIHVHSDRMSMSAYLAFVGLADTLSVHPSGGLDLKTPSRTGIYLAQFLKRFGVEFVGFPSHPDKTAANLLTQAGPTSAEHEQWRRLLNARRQLVLEILQSRPQIVRADQALDEGPFQAVDPRLLAWGLVDVVQTRQQFLSALEREYGHFQRIMERTPFQKTRWEGLHQTNLALVYAIGEILDERQRPDQIDPPSLLQRLQQAFADPSVAGVVLRVDSPGGSILASDEIGRGIRSLRNRYGKPLYVSMASVAASGGYYISAPADKIFASEATVTGSIGVIFATLQIDDLLREQQIVATLVGSERRPVEPNPLLPMTPEIRDRLSRDVGLYYQRFVDWVQENRRLSPEELDRAARARIWTGKEAQELKLVDEVGGLEQAIGALARDLGLSEWRVIEYRPTFGFDFASALPELGRVLAREWGVEETVEELGRARALLGREGAYLFWAPELRGLSRP